ncbi:MAG: RNA polymerase factor sigma-54 [Fimbriimonadaceae bacterium]|nr:RNA polymerase factor sigma-54 [Fimbriimonadaceae bacterium]QYK56360.1 MAG: RNA polymerase factor sigma-54 [Fimbriimonadaceae bacterium]
MADGMGQHVGARVSTSVRIDPRVILASQVLQLNHAELLQAVETELAENPALERIEDSETPVTLDEILKTVAPAELKPSSDNRELQRSLPRDGEQEFDWLDFTPDSDTLWDHLRAQLLPQLPDHEKDLGNYLIASVNDRGYLTVSLEEVALDCNVTLESSAKAIELLKQCEPAGVGANDLRECLLLQLRGHSEADHRLARTILRQDWDLLVQRDVRALRRKYKTSDEAIRKVFEIVTGLNPFPGEGFKAHVCIGADRSVGAQADLVLARDETGWRIEVPGPTACSLRIDDAYASRYRLIAKGRVPKEERGHIQEFVDRANRFIDAISQRHKTMLQIGRFFVEQQSGFVSTGDYKFLNPLTRVQLAAHLGLHESSVSRATNGKFVQIATGEILSFDVFFKPALRIQKMIEEILSTENPSCPFSDESIAQILHEKGVKVARRTVNKYRDKTKLLSSRHRRSA